jgi:hypothetical protein
MGDENIARSYLDKSQPEATQRATTFAVLAVHEEVSKLNHRVENLEKLLDEILKTLKLNNPK